jgi:dTDP-4-amino-4,6-dideoxygalactose transaminase
MQVPLLDLTKQYQPLRDQIRAVIDELTDAQQFILGPKVEAFEKAVCEYTGARHALGVSSGTDALLVILMALGIGPGDAVVTTPYTFFATAGCIARVGARPIFVDIDPATYNISVDGLRECLEKNRNAKIKAIMPVHLFGLSCAMDEICALAAEHGNLSVIEDAAQALGAQYPSKQGVKQCGAIGDFGSYSFFPSKNLGAFGDAGMVICRDDPMARRLRALRNHGMEDRYFHKMIGGNFRIDALQAAVLHIKLPHLDEWSAARRANAHFYREEFAHVGLDRVLTLPVEPYAAAEEDAPNHHIYNQFVVRVPGQGKRDELCKYLTIHQIGNAIYYPVALHQQECFAYLGYREGDFPEAERAARETLALPIFPELTRDQQRYVVETIRAFHAK